MTTRQQKPALLDRQPPASAMRPAIRPANRDIRGKLLTQPLHYKKPTNNSGDGLPSIGEQAEEELLKMPLG